MSDASGMPRSLVLDAISRGVFPGAAWAWGRGGEFAVDVAGRLGRGEEWPEVSPDTLYDLASLTKVIGTTTVAMGLFDAGRLDLDAPVAGWVPEFAGEDRAGITPRDLLLHRAGLPPFRPYHRLGLPAAGVLRRVLEEPLVRPPRSATEYSDLSMIILQVVLERIAGRPLDELIAPGQVFRPADRTLCAPTERAEEWRPQPGEWLRGEVHDPTAAALGGVAGHAGMFGSVRQVAAFAVRLSRGEVGAPGTLRAWTTRADASSSRALGWDTRSPQGSSAGTRFGPRAFGHTGFTGTSIWVDPDDGRWAVLLTNRVHPSAEDRRILAFRPEFHDVLPFPP